MLGLNFKTYFNLLTEANESSGRFIDLRWYNGGIPDLSGPATAYSEPLLWATPKRNLLSSQEYKAALLSDGKLVFFKHPGKFTKENILPKLERYLDEIMDYNEQIVKIFRVEPSVIEAIGKRVCTYEEYKSYGEEVTQDRKKHWYNDGGLGKLASKVYGDGIDPELSSGNREEITAKIKEKATALAREKMRILMSNGVSREDALSAAKEAYRKFIKSFHDKSSLGKLNTAPGHVRSDYHPLMSKTGEKIKNSMRDESRAKEAKQNAYRRAINDGYSRAEAERKAQEAYNSIMGS